MIQFKCKNSDLIHFLEKCAARGYVTITKASKIRRYFFKYFYLDVEEDQLAVRAVDYGERRMFIRHFLKGIEVVEEGRLAITDIETLLNVLQAIPKDRKISVVYNEETKKFDIETIELESGSRWYGYELRQAEGKEINTALGNSTHSVAAWDRIHSFEDGLPKIEMTDPESGKIKKDFYDTVFKISKSVLMEIVDNSVNLTEDEEIRISMEEGRVFFQSGKASDDIKSTLELNIDVENPIEFREQIVTNLQPIVSYLAPEITFYCRLVEKSNTLKIWIRSEEDNIELNFCSGSHK